MHISTTPLHLGAGRELLPMRVDRRVQDAVMVTTLRGHSSLTQRQQVLMAVKSSKLAGQGGGVENCTALDTCEGTRFQRTRADEGQAFTAKTMATKRWKQLHK